MINSSMGPTRLRKAYLVTEFFGLFVLLPIVAFLFRHIFKSFLIPVLIIISLGCTLLLLIDPSFDRQLLTRAERPIHWLKRMLLTFLPWSAVLTLTCAAYRRDLLLAFPLNDTATWFLVLILYPLLSAFPQEVIFRTFFFHRYRLLFPTTTVMIFASGLSFGLAHLFFANWVAPILGAVGGLLFARTYAQTFSTLLVSVEHSIWGNFMFTIGLGWYFYGGAIN